ncbi:alpha/beta-hydrolase [Fomitopsis serialis]|uniref:alpha/beta-hydrolase n=1 Tax=Fomitopsis serialis TaxID=139415 RepID=UPI0020085A5C|nr:alpha/beta-hydrolase [Neoantrodia serialis]KAH9922660.1 alpha/beta-hydrolase [Neoantrodia serialis]
MEQPFTISVPDSEIELLRRKLEVTRLPDELDDAGWDYGAPLADVRRMVAYWKDGYDWRKAEAEINTLPQFTRDIEVDGFGALNIHYVHQKSTVENAVPLLFVHGWPGHFLEVRKMLPLLTAGSEDHPSFHVVALSLPNFGFSEAPKKKGFGSHQYAEVCNKLMLALGYSEYVVQGGDWGYLLGKVIVSDYGHKTVKAWHTNMPVSGPPSIWTHPGRFLAFLGSLALPWSERDKAGMARTMEARSKGMGYFKEQSTQPQTLGYSLADSPAGLLAWIYEKLVRWTDSYPWTDDEVLTWISVYWFSRAGPAASVRIYYEVTGGGDPVAGGTWSSIPLGLSYFPKEIAVVPKLWARTIGNVVHESDHERGGHFAAFERPEDLAGDVRAMFAKGGPAYGVVPGKDGYA